MSKNITLTSLLLCVVILLTGILCQTVEASTKDAQYVCEREQKDWIKFYNKYTDLQVYHYMRMGNLYECRIKVRKVSASGKKYTVTLRLTFNSTTNRRAVFETGY